MTRIIHPFLFAAMPVICSLERTKKLVLLTDGLAALVVCELSVVVVYGITWLFLRNAQKSALVASLTMCLMFCFHVFHVGVNAMVQRMGLAAPHGLVSLALFALLFAIMVSSVLKNEWKFGRHSFKVNTERFTFALNVASIILVVCNTLPLLATQFQLAQIDSDITATFHKKIPDVAVATSAVKPDIYYIILDAYGHEQTLKAFWNYDNKDFLDFLRKRGFYVVDKAISNYDRTALSLSSSLNMQYLDEAKDKLGKQWFAQTIFFHLIQDNCFYRVLKNAGYKWINFSTGFSADDDIPQAQNIHATYGSNFNVFLFMMTPLEVTDDYFPILRDMFADAYVAPDRYLNEVAGIPGPKFVFIHCNLPHPPYVFDEKGNRLPLDLVSNTHYSQPEAYLKQVKFAEIEARKWLAALLDRPGPPPVIIVQSDHGPLFSSVDLKSHVNERMRILNAVYFPGMNNKGLYDSMSPVNTFRVFLNDYFDAKLPTLPDRAFHSRSDDYGLAYEDVTSLVEFNRE